jgi:hypothetical protein
VAIYKITKIEYDKHRHDQEWGVHKVLLFEFEGGRYKCDMLGAAGLKEIMRFQQAKRKLKSDQLNLLGLPIDV